MAAMVAISHARIVAVVIALDLIIIISKQVMAVGYAVKVWAKRLGAMVGAVWLANVARNSALVTSFVGLTSATLASTKASIANAFSVQGQITAYNALSTRLMLLRLTKAHYIDLTKTAITTTAVYARSLVGLATSFDRTTLATKAATLASIGWTKTKRGAAGVGILATRAITGLGGAFMALGRIITAHPIIAIGAVLASVVVSTHGVTGALESLSDAFGVTTLMAKDFIVFVGDGFSMAWDAVSAFADNMLVRWAIPQRAVRGHLLAFLTQAMVALWVCYKLPPKPLI